MAYKHELAIKLLSEAMDTYAEAYDLEEMDEIYAIMHDTVEQIASLANDDES